ncbi:sigma factor-like helix-turn-helix DNA-binding protein [Escherichia coli]|uniref:sigma factor-like helix-turn-helix DNA-binding protein n=1 Tax=Escherichia coli TaxID=562 RepID=UPI003D654CCA
MPYQTEEGCSQAGHSDIILYSVMMSIQILFVFFFTGEACCILNKSMLNLRAAGGVLTLEERRAVLNRYYRGLSIAEITEETGQNDKTVYGHLRRALQRSGFRKGRFIKGREAAGDSGVE